jgi:hypothetical protein
LILYDTDRKQVKIRNDKVKTRLLSQLGQSIAADPLFDCEGTLLILELTKKFKPSVLVGNDEILQINSGLFEVAWLWIP